jgi:hypothetical protein
LSGIRKKGLDVLSRIHADYFLDEIQHNRVNSYLLRAGFLSFTDQIKKK